MVPRRQVAAGCHTVGASLRHLPVVLLVVAAVEAGLNRRSALSVWIDSVARAKLSVVVLGFAVEDSGTEQENQRKLGCRAIEGRYGPNPIVGTWRLVSFEVRSAADRVSYPYGPDALGYIIRILAHSGPVNI